MSYKFDKSEVPQFMPEGGFQCVACLEKVDTDHISGLCRPCWRIVILGPAMENQP